MQPESKRLAPLHDMTPGRLAPLLLAACLLGPVQGQAAPSSSECAVIINYGAAFGYGVAQSTIDVFSGSFRIFNNQSVRFSPASLVDIALKCRQLHRIARRTACHASTAHHMSGAPVGCGRLAFCLKTRRAHASQAGQPLLRGPG